MHLPRQFFWHQAWLYQTTATCCLPFSPFFSSVFFFRDSWGVNTALSKNMRIFCKRLRRNKLPKLTTFSYFFQLPHSAVVQKMHRIIGHYYWNLKQMASLTFAKLLKITLPVQTKNSSFLAFGFRILLLYELKQIFCYDGNQLSPGLWTFVWIRRKSQHSAWWWWSYTTDDDDDDRTQNIVMMVILMIIILMHDDDGQTQMIVIMMTLMIIML